LVQGDEGPAQIVRLGHRGTPSIDVSDEIAILAARPIASLRWRKESRANPSLKHVHIGVRWSRRQPGGEGAIKKIGINPMHYPLIKCPSGARQAAPQLKDLDTPRRLVIKYKINLLYWN